MKRQPLTREQVIQRISAYPTRNQLRRKDKQGYRLAAKHGVLPAPGEVKLPLTLDELKMRASHHPHRTSFKRNDQSAYDSAKRQGFLDELFGPVIKVVAKPKAPPKPRVKKEPKPKLPHGGQVKWTEPAIRNAAAVVDRITAMPKSAQNRLLKMPALSLELFPTPASSMLSDEEFISRAKVKHGNKFDYSKVRYNGTQEKVLISCPDHGEFWQRPASHLEGHGCARCWKFDNNAFYMKRAEGCWFNGHPVFKVGVTSARLGNRRLIQQERKSGIKHRVEVPPTELVGFATVVEGFALGLGHNPGYLGFDGCTEYRAYSDEDVQAIRTMVELCRK